MANALGVAAGEWLHYPDYILCGVVVRLSDGGVRAIAVLQQRVPVRVPRDRIRGLRRDGYVVLGTCTEHTRRRTHEVLREELSGYNSRAD